MESILTSIKKMLGITEEYEHFDSDLIIHINSVFMILTQLGVGPPSGFSIQDKSTTWKEFISDETKLQLVKSYMHMKVMGNCIVMEDTNGNRKLLKKRYDAKIDAVAAMMDAFVAFKLNRDAFE